MAGPHEQENDDEADGNDEGCDKGTVDEDDGDKDDDDDDEHEDVGERSITPALNPPALTTSSLPVTIQGGYQTQWNGNVTLAPSSDQQAAFGQSSPLEPTKSLDRPQALFRDRQARVLRGVRFPLLQTRLLE
ncbi:hypothetical protein HKX48_007209 [Thoreauomyces humboldtii]|nr:hypothetical protein HKX48_007209 [Thoreauomyces humboldtii]